MRLFGFQMKMGANNYIIPNNDNEWTFVPNKRQWGTPMDGHCYGKSCHTLIHIFKRLIIIQNCICMQNHKNWQ